SRDAPASWHRQLAPRAAAVSQRRPYHHAIWHHGSQACRRWSRHHSPFGIMILTLPQHRGGPGRLIGMTVQNDQAATEPAAQALEDLYRAHALGLIRFALMLVGDQTTAEDVVQEAFLGLYRGWHRVRD